MLRSLLSADGWPYLLAPLIPIAVVLELTHASDVAIFVTAALGVVPRSATDLVDALQEAGLVERIVDPNNRRSVLVELTRQGRDIQQAMADARAATAATLFGTLAPAERALLAELLGRVGAEQVADDADHVHRGPKR